MKDRWGLTKSQRMQLKAFICLLGLILLGVLFVGAFFSAALRKEPEKEGSAGPSGGSDPPLEQVFSNVWILEEETDGLVIFREGNRERYPYGETVEIEDRGAGGPKGSVREQLADLYLTEGAVTGISLKTEKISGKILGMDEGGVEVEGYGRMPLAPDWQGYRLYQSPAMCGEKDLPIGCENADFCLEDGQICGILLTGEEAMEYIRVLIKSSDYADLYHSRLVFTSDTGFTISYGAYEDRQTQSYGPGEEAVIDPSGVYFQGDRITVAPKALTGKLTIQNLARSQGTPSYRGRFELMLTEKGIVAVNEVALEEYLYSVVPSEMPAGYPAEALKAQAICARTYAYSHMEHAGYPEYGAHVDDSTSYQVYNNILEQESSTQAVKETYGQLLYTKQGEPASVFYYSTSCGVGSDATVWKTGDSPDLPYLRAKRISKTAMARQTQAAVQEGTGLGEDGGEALKEEETFRDFISRTDPDDFESNQAWYRWTYSAGAPDSGRMSRVLQARYQANENLVLTWKDGEFVSQTIGEIGAVTEICVTKRGAGGVAEELVIRAKNGVYQVISEYNIRCVLCDGASKAVRQDGSQVSCPTLLPSGFFVIDTETSSKGLVTGYTLTGGGFGHGVGMSQNGAGQMAENGCSAGEILTFFFEGCRVETVYGTH